MKKIIILLIIAVSEISCEKVLDISIPEGDKHIVVSGFLNPDTLIEVKITKSQGMFDESSITYLKDAQVKLYEDNIYIEDLNYEWFEGFFVSSVTPVIGKTYRIDVDYPGLTSVSAQNILPEKVNIISSEVKYEWDSDESIYKMNYKVEIENTYNTKNYYFIGVSDKHDYNDITGNVYQIIISSNMESDDPVLSSEHNDFNFNDFTGKVFNDDLFAGSSKTICFSTKAHKLDGEIIKKYTVCVASITEDLYKYVISYNKYFKTDENPFDQPIQIYSNIENGLGIFSGFTPSCVTLELD